MSHWRFQFTGKRSPACQACRSVTSDMSRQAAMSISRAPRSLGALQTVVMACAFETRSGRRLW